MRRVVNALQLQFLLALGLFLASGAAAFCQGKETPTDPVYSLEMVLNHAIQDVRAREAQVARCVDLLQNVNDYRRALSLTAWRDRAAEDPFADVDRAQRALVVDRFVLSLRRGLLTGPLNEQLDLLAALAQLDIRDTEGLRVSRQLTVDVVTLTRRHVPALREAATKALGQVGMDPTLGVTSLAELLGDADPLLRNTAAGSLVQLAGNANQEALAGDRRTAVDICRLVAPVCATGLSDGNGLVRLRCTEALHRCAEVLATLIPPPVTPGDAEHAIALTQQVAEETGLVMPLVMALRQQTAAVARVTGDAEPQVRLRARQALQDIAEVRLRLLNRTSSVLGLRGGSSVAEAQASLVVFVREDPLRHGLVEALPALTAGLSDPDVRARRAAVDVLETLGPAAATAGPALVQALSDSDRFVRWAAARALGKVKPATSAPVIAHLARLLSDSDPNLRVAAATTLRDYGAAARPALPELLDAARSRDGELRLAALQALESLGSDESDALAVISAAVNDSDVRIRKHAADALLRVARKGPPEKAVGSVTKQP